MKVVIVHPEMGIYLGNCLGLGFFSMLDCAGQITAALIESEAEAREHVSTWSTKNDPDTYRYVEVTAVRQWATIEELEAAGLGEFTAPLRDERLRSLPAAGRA